MPSHWIIHYQREHLPRFLYYFKPNVGSKDDWCTSRIHRPWSGRIFNKEAEGIPQCCSATWRGQRALSFTFLAFCICNNLIHVSGIWQKYCEWCLKIITSNFTSWLIGFRPGISNLPCDICGRFKRTKMTAFFLIEIPFLGWESSSGCANSYAAVIWWGNALLEISLTAIVVVASKFN